MLRISTRAIRGREETVKDDLSRRQSLRLYSKKFRISIIRAIRLRISIIRAIRLRISTRARGREETIKDDLSLDNHCDCIAGVPRVWEKIEEKMKELGRKNTGIKKEVIIFIL